MAFIDLIFDMNPWWRDRQAIQQDKHIRTFEASKIKWHPPLLKISLQEDALHIIKEPRQVGKTTLLKLFIRNLLADDKVSGILWIGKSLRMKRAWVPTTRHTTISAYFPTLIFFISSKP